VDVAEGSGVDGFGGAERSVQGRPGKSGGGIGDDVGGEAEVAGHARGGGDAVVGGESHEDECVDVVVVEIVLQGGSDEGAVHVFAIDGLGGMRRRERLNRVAWRLRAEEAVWLDGIVNDMADGPARVAPCGEEASDVRFCFGIVAFAPARIEKRLLNIDEDERGGLRELVHGEWREVRLRRWVDCILTRSGRGSARGRGTDFRGRQDEFPWTVAPFPTTGNEGTFGREAGRKGVEL